MNTIIISIPIISFGLVTCGGPVSKFIGLVLGSLTSVNGSFMIWT